ncbi:MAG TPA: polyphenol oxidase family protein [Solirubrobacteraceae bacterium]
MASAASLPLPTPFRLWDAQITTDLPGGKVLFSTRRGGVSAGPYASMNLGAIAPVAGESGHGDDAELVLANRKRLAAQIGLPVDRFAHARQVHGARVMRLRQPPTGAWGTPRGTRGLAGLPDADGQASGLADVATVVLVADCLPVALVGSGGVAMLHAGWRGLAAGVLAQGVGALRELGVDGPLAAAIGPGARGCCYQVGPEFRERFAAYGEGIFRKDRLDLAAVAASQLAALGITTVHDTEICTICSEPSLFFSHRRDQGITGRQAGIAWRS